jgi:hypothetical protein
MMLHDEVKAMRVDLMAARSELQKAITTANVVSNENAVSKNELLGAKAVIAGAQVEHQSLVTKADAANNLVNRLQADLAQTVCTARGEGSGEL